MLIDPRSVKQLETYKSDLPQSLLLTGQSGVGLLTAAKCLADGYDVLTLQPHNKKGDYDSISGTITVETIRTLYGATSGKRKNVQVIIIDDADAMSRGAQTAFLKLLEEPRDTTKFILTSHTPETLLPTIRSRVQRVTIHPLTQRQTLELLTTLTVNDATKKAQLQFIAAGLPAELTRLARDEAYFKKRAKVMADARSFLQASSYDKLLLVNSYRDDRFMAEALIGAAIIIVRRSLSANPQPALVQKLAALLLIQENIRANMSVRLQLATFVL